MLYHSCLSVKRKKSLTDLWSYFCVSVRMIDGCVPAHTVMSSLSCDWEGRGGAGLHALPRVSGELQLSQQDRRVEAAGVSGET